jgi:hypothetical protein
MLVPVLRKPALSLSIHEVRASGCAEGDNSSACVTVAVSVTCCGSEFVVTDAVTVEVVFFLKKLNIVCVCGETAFYETRLHPANRPEVCEELAAWQVTSGA